MPKVTGIIAVLLLATGGAAAGATPADTITEEAVTAKFDRLKEILDTTQPDAMTELTALQGVLSVFEVEPEKLGENWRRRSFLKKRVVERLKTRAFADGPAAPGREARLAALMLAELGELSVLSDLPVVRKMITGLSSSNRNVRLKTFRDAAADRDFMRKLLRRLVESEHPGPARRIEVSKTSIDVGEKVDYRYSVEPRGLGYWWYAGRRMEPTVVPSVVRWRVYVKHGDIRSSIGVGGGGRGGGGRFGAKTAPPHFITQYRFVAAGPPLTGTGAATPSGYGTLSVEWASYGGDRRVTFDPDHDPEKTPKPDAGEQWTAGLPGVEGGDGVRVTVLPPGELRGREAGGCALQGFFLAAGEEREILGRKVSTKENALHMALSLKQKTPLKVLDLGAVGRKFLWVIILDEKGMFVDMIAPLVTSQSIATRMEAKSSDHEFVDLHAHHLNTQLDADKFIELDAKNRPDVRASVPLNDLPGPGKYRAIAGLGPFVPDGELPPPKDYWMGEVISKPVEIVISE